MATRNSDQTIQWQEHLDKYKASGQSRRAYCRDHGLKLHQLAYRLDRLRTKPASKTSAFVRVVTASAVAPVPNRFAARLIFGGGIALELDSGMDPAWLARLVAHVGGRL